MPIITAIACLIVYAYSHPTHVPKAVYYYFMCLCFYEIEQVVVLIVFFLGMSVWSVFDHIAVVGVFLSILFVTPLSLYYCYWLYKSLTLTIMSF